MVSGCRDAKISSAIEGVYRICEKDQDNHCKPVYWKKATVTSVEAFIYFWDKRDGKEHNGWWIGPAVGTDIIWTFNDDTTASRPPRIGWRIPWDGPVDVKFKLAYVNSSVNATTSTNKDNYQHGRGKEAESRKEVLAANAIRVALQTLLQAEPADYDARKRELEIIRAQNLDELGSLEEHIMREFAEISRYAQERVDRQRAEEKAEQIKRQEAFARIEEDNKRKQAFLQAIAEANTDIQALLAKAGLTLQADDMDRTDLETIWLIAEDAESAAEHMRAKENDIIRRFQDIMCDSSCNADLFIQQPQSKSLPEVLVSAKGTLVQNVAALKAASRKAMRAADALRTFAERIKLFMEFDENTKGLLNREDVKKYSIKKHGFHLQDEVLNKIMNSLEPITVKKLRMLHVKISIAKSESIARRRKNEELQKKQMLEARQQTLTREQCDAGERIAKVQKTLHQAKQQLQLVCDPQNSNVLTSTVMKTIIVEVQRLVAKAEEEVNMAQQAVKQVEESITVLVEGEIAVDTAHLVDLEKQMRLIVEMLDRVRGLLETTPAIVEAKISSEIRNLIHDSVEVIHAYMVLENKTTSDIVTQVAGDAEIVSKTAYVQFIKHLADHVPTTRLTFNLEEWQAELMYTYMADKTNELPKHSLLQLIRMFYKCQRGTVLSQDVDLKSKTVRHLAEGETVECLLGPVDTNVSNLRRIKCCTVKDGLTGWASITSSKGERFLEPGGDEFRCIKAVVLSDNLSIADSKPIRRISETETGKVLEFPTLDPGTKLERIRCKMDKDHVIGWLTVFGSHGTKFIEIS